MGKFSAAQAIAAAAAIRTGQLAGKAQGVQVRRQQEADDYHRALQAFQAGHELENEQFSQEEAFDQGIGALLPQLAPDSRARVQAQLLERAHARGQRPRQFGVDQLGQIVPAGTPWPHGAPASPLPTPPSSPMPSPHAGAAAAMGVGPVQIPERQAPAPASSPTAAPPPPAVNLPPEQQHLLGQAMAALAPFLGPHAAVIGHELQAPTPAAAAAPAPSAAAPASSSGVADTGAAPAPPSAAPAPFRMTLPEFGDVELTHFTPDQLTQIQGVVEDRVKFVEQFKADAPTQKKLVSLLRRLPPVLQTPQDVTAAMDFLNQTAEILPGGSHSLRGVGELRGRDAQRQLNDRVASLARMPLETAAETLPQLLAAEDAMAADLPGGIPISPLGGQRARIQKLASLLASEDPEDQKNALKLTKTIVSRLSLGLDPRQRAAAERAVAAEVRQLSPDEANDLETVNGIRARNGLEPLTTAPRYGATRAQQTLDRLLGQAPKFSKAPLPARRAYLLRVKNAAKAAGEVVNLGKEFLEVVPDEAARLRLEAAGVRLETAKIQRDRAGLAKQRDAVKAAGATQPAPAKMSDLDKRRWQKYAKIAYGMKRDISGESLPAFSTEERQQALAAMAKLSRQYGEGSSPAPSLSPPGTKQTAPSRGELQHVQAVVTSGHFDTWMASPDLQDPILRRRAKVAYKQIMKRAWKGGK